MQLAQAPRRRSPRHRMESRRRWSPWGRRSSWRRASAWDRRGPHSRLGPPQPLQPPEFAESRQPIGPAPLLGSQQRTRVPYGRRSPLCNSLCRRRRFGSRRVSQSMRSREPRQPMQSRHPRGRRSPSGHASAWGRRRPHGRLGSPQPTQPLELMEPQQPTGRHRDRRRSSAWAYGRKGRRSMWCGSGCRGAERAGAAHDPRLAQPAAAHRPRGPHRRLPRRRGRLRLRGRGRGDARARRRGPRRSAVHCSWFAWRVVSGRGRRPRLGWVESGDAELMSIDFPEVALRDEVLESARRVHAVYSTPTSSALPSR